MWSEICVGLHEKCCVCRSAWKVLCVSVCMKSAVCVGLHEKCRVCRSALKVPCVSVCMKSAMCVGLHEKCPNVILSYFNDTWNFSTDLRKDTDIRVHENPRSWSQGGSMGGGGGGGRTDRRDKADSRFSHFCERAHKPAISQYTFYRSVFVVLGNCCLWGPNWIFMYPVM